MVEKGIDIVGKSSIVAIPVSEAANNAGWWAINIDTFQCISAAGVIVLIVDRIVRLLWERHDRKKAGK